MNIDKLRLIIVLGILAIGFCLAFLYAFQFLNISYPVQTKVLEIKTGASFGEVIEELKTAGIIRSESIIKIYGLLTNQTGQIKPGRYILSSHISIPRLVGILAKGPAETSVLIAPGMTVKEIDEKLSAASVIEPNDLINFKFDSLKNDYPWLKDAQSLEGFLFPDTYNFFSGSDINSVVRKLLDNFAAKVLPFSGNGSNLLKTVNLASLLEKEVPGIQDRQLVAGILIKRLTAGMPLQVDASLIYGKCYGKFLNCPPLQEADYKFNSPYNTYLYKGLPKTPIGNPGLEAIRAALNPQKSDYWYYLSDPKTQKTVFSKTLDEHNENRAKYLY